MIIEYHPKLPDLRQLAAQPPGPIVKFGTEDGEAETIRLTAQLERVSLAAQLEIAPERVGRAVVLLNGEPPARERELNINRKTGTISGTVRLPRGKNQIQIQLSNPWHTTTFGPIVIEYRRPPRVQQWEPRLLEGRPFARISADCIADRFVHAQIEVSSRNRIPSTAQTSPRHREPRGEGGWSVLAEVPLSQGANDVTLRTWNEDGPSLEISNQLVYEKPVEPKPVVSVESPEVAVVRRPTISLQFRVRSNSALTSEKLFRERSSGARELVDEYQIGQLARNRDGAFEFPCKSEMRTRRRPKLIHHRDCQCRR